MQDMKSYYLRWLLLYFLASTYLWVVAESAALQNCYQTVTTAEEEYVEEEEQELPNDKDVLSDDSTLASREEIETEIMGELKKMAMSGGEEAQKAAAALSEIRKNLQNGASLSIAISKAGEKMFPKEWLGGMKSIIGRAFFDYVKKYMQELWFLKLLRERIEHNGGSSKSINTNVLHDSKMSKRNYQEVDKNIPSKRQYLEITEESEKEDDELNEKSDKIYNEQRTPKKVVNPQNSQKLNESINSSKISAKSRKVTRETRKPTSTNNKTQQYTSSRTNHLEEISDDSGNHSDSIEQERQDFSSQTKTRQLSSSKTSMTKLKTAGQTPLANEKNTRQIASQKSSVKKSELMDESESTNEFETEREDEIEGESENFNDNSNSDFENDKIPITKKKYKTTRINNLKNGTHSLGDQKNESVKISEKIVHNNPVKKSVNRIVIIETDDSIESEEDALELATPYLKRSQKGGGKISRTNNFENEIQTQKPSISEKPMTIQNNKAGQRVNVRKDDKNFDSKKVGTDRVTQKSSLRKSSMPQNSQAEISDTNNDSVHTVYDFKVSENSNLQKSENNESAVDKPAKTPMPVRKSNKVKRISTSVDSQIKTPLKTSNSGKFKIQPGLKSGVDTNLNQPVNNKTTKNVGEIENKKKTNSIYDEESKQTNVSDSNWRVKKSLLYKYTQTEGLKDTEELTEVREPETEDIIEVEDIDELISILGTDKREIVPPISHSSKVEGLKKSATIPAKSLRSNNTSCKKTEFQSLKSERSGSTIRDAGKELDSTNNDSDDLHSDSTQNVDSKNSSRFKIKGSSPNSKTPLVDTVEKMSSSFKNDANLKSYGDEEYGTNLENQPKKPRTYFDEQKQSLKSSSHSAMKLLEHTNKTETLKNNGVRRSFSGKTGIGRLSSGPVANSASSESSQVQPINISEDAEGTQHRNEFNQKTSKQHVCKDNTDSQNTSNGIQNSSTPVAQSLPAPSNLNDFLKQLHSISLKLTQKIDPYKKKQWHSTSSSNGDGETYFQTFPNPNAGNSVKFFMKFKSAPSQINDTFMKEFLSNNGFIGSNTASMSKSKSSQQPLSSSTTETTFTEFNEWPSRVENLEQSQQKLGDAFSFGGNSQYSQEDHYYYETVGPSYNDDNILYNEAENWEESK